MTEKSIDRSNIQPQRKPVIVQRVVTYQQDREGKWKEDKTCGILLNPDGRFPR